MCPPLAIRFLALAGTVFAVLAGCPAAGAQCSEQIAENVRIPQGQRVETTDQTLVVRGSYRYTLRLEASPRGVRALLNSRGGEVPNQGDELILASGDDRRAFRFLGEAKRVQVAGAPAYENYLQLDLPTAEWLANTDIDVIVLKNNRKGQGRRWSLSGGRQAELRQLATCFTTAIDPNALPEIPAVSVAIPAVARPRAPDIDRSSELTRKPGTETLAEAEARRRVERQREVDSLRADLKRLRAELLQQVALEKAKAERAKAVIAEDLAASRRAADAQAAAFAAEVVAARRRAEARIAADELRASERARELSTQTATAESESAARVGQARTRSREAIARIQREAAEEVSAIRQRAAQSAEADRERLKAIQSDYRREVDAAKAAGAAELVAIRNALDEQLERARKLAVTARDSSEQTAKEARLSARKEILAAREAALRDVAEVREAAAAEREAQRILLAEAKQAAALAEARQRAELQTELARMREALITERAHHEAELASARQAAEEALASLGRDTALAAANARAAAEQRIAAERERTEEAAREALDRRRLIAATVDSARRRALDAISRAQAEEAAAIAVAREAALRERERLSASLARDLRTLANRRRELLSTRERRMAETSERRRAADSLAHRRALRRPDQGPPVLPRANLAAGDSTLVASRARLLDSLRKADIARILRSRALSDSLARRVAEVAQWARDTVAEVEIAAAQRINALQDEAILEQEALLKDLNEIRVTLAGDVTQAREAAARDISTARQQAADEIERTSRSLSRDIAHRRARHRHITDSLDRAVDTLLRDHRDHLDSLATLRREALVQDSLMIARSAAARDDSLAVYDQHLMELRLRRSRELTLTQRSRRRLDSLRHAVADAEEGVAQMTATIREHEATLAGLAAREATLGDSLSQRLTRISAAEARDAELLQAIETARAQLDGLREERELLRREVDELQLRREELRRMLEEPTGVVPDR